VKPASPDVLILYKRPLASGEPGSDFAESDAGVLHEVEAVEAALRAHGRPVRRVGVWRLRDIPAALAAGTEPIVFNLVERLDDFITAFNFVPVICEALGRSCTGGSSDALSLTLDKWLAKARLRAFGVGVADAIMLPPGAAIDPALLPPFPLIVKPLASGGSEGIDSTLSVARDLASLERAATWIHKQFEQPALAECYIEGREFNVSLIERNGTIEAMPVSEIDFSLFPEGRPPIVDYAVKWVPGTIPGHVSPRKVPADLDAETAARLKAEAVKAWHACGCRDYARIDFRMDRQGRTYVLEVNVNPDIEPLAGLPASIKAAGISFDQFVMTIVANAERRRRA